jgi:hypothetical protein
MTARLVVMLILGSLVVTADALAQTCRGTAPIGSTNPGQVFGGFTNETDEQSVFAGAAGGNDAAFGLFQVEHSNLKDSTLSATVLSGDVGAQIAIDRDRRAVICPTFGAGYLFGPQNLPPDGRDLSGWLVVGGGTLGVSAVRTSGIEVVPAFGLFVQRLTTKVSFEDASVSQSTTDGLLALGVGVVVQQRLSIVPQALIPVAGDTDGPTIFRLLVAVSFPRR